MAKYYIESYTKKKRTFLATLNSMSETTGGIVEPYEITLKKIWFFDIITSYITKTFYLPKGFDHESEFTKGREFVMPKK